MFNQLLMSLLWHPLNNRVSYYWLDWGCSAFLTINLYQFQLQGRLRFIKMPAKSERTGGFFVGKVNNLCANPGQHKVIKLGCPSTQKNINWGIIKEGQGHKLLVKKRGFFEVRPWRKLINSRFYLAFLWATALMGTLR